MALPRTITRIGDWIRRLPPAVLLILGILLTAGVGVGGVFMYRTYSYIEHDNDFCMSCHLMQEPHEQFARSEHRGLGCKACHQPTMVVRTQMALTQILENPGEIHTHAEVPNRACASCHVEGDPETWRQIASSVGHRVHIESDDPALQGLQCVQCHSASIHRFTGVNRTCAQSGCHEDTRMRLGKMGSLTIHCVGCHDFSRPSSDTVAGDIAVKPLQPRRDECLSCHAMRTLLADFPADEPHEAACGACHNPHDQETPRQAQRTCANGGCHAQPDTLSPMHRGLAVGVLQDCLACHPAHVFRVQGDNCLGCHQDIFRDVPRTSAAPRTPPAPQSPQVSTSLGARLASLVPAALRAAPVQAVVQPAAQARRDVPLDFSHNRHRQVQCAQCHNSERTHGAVTVTSVRECRECHHTPAAGSRATGSSATAAAPACTNCHRPAEFLATRHPIAQTLRLSVGAPRTRRLPFVHAQHPRVECAQCHGPTLTREVTVGCNSCHEQHHEPNRSCISCHTSPPTTAHTVDAHLGCAGAGCHSPVPFQGVPRTRNLCLSCHQGLTDHEPGRNCINCHALPRPRAEGTTVPHGPALAERGAAKGEHP
jgi:hypothetical protein